ncbi:AAA family ATPase [Streptoalloteichus hindustanus]|uniref:Regulatory protein, luxR family n=1 Tax=Streptoalloteichus hindustanus TaxID=2017 RepID=A0A1M5PFN7_STRHI|nr:LuxR family transcriptional regulator [Streptoalloteichus hindustanus]SHH00540.1 regulatory protein, luxR family [Streptoalloteichus hindustanus]
MLFERDHELTTAANLAARARAGSGGLLVVAGGPGVGKTTLLDEIALREAGPAPDRMRVLRARCSAEESGFRLGVARQLFEVALEERCPLRGDQPSGPDDEAFDHLDVLLRRLAEEEPLLLVVDDVHVADPASLRYLVRCADLLADLPVLLVVAERTNPGVPGRLAAVGAATVLRPRPLSPATVARIVRAGLGPTTPDEVCDECARMTTGHPLLVHALVRDLALMAGDGPVGRAPRRLADVGGGAFVRALHRLTNDGGTRRDHLLRVIAAVEGEDHAAELLPALTGETLPWLADWLAAMREQGVLDRADPPRFTHPVLRDAVLALCSEPEEQGALHRRVAALLHERRAAPEAVARHLVQADVVAERWMADTLWTAGRRAWSGGRPEEATAFLRRALDAPLSPERRSLVLARLGEVEISVNSEAAVRRLTEALREAGPRLSARIAPSLGAVLAANGRVDAALRLLDDVGARVGDGDGFAAATRAAAALIAAQDVLTWPAAVRRLRAAAAAAPGEIEPVARGLLAVCDATAGLVSAEEALARIAPRPPAPPPPALLPYWHASAAIVTRWADRLPEARRIADEVLGDRPDLSDPARRVLAGARAAAAVAEGAFARAIEESEPLVVAATRGGVRPVHVVSQVVLALVGLDRLPEASRLVELVAGDESTSWEWCDLLYARGVLRAASGDLAGALADFQDCGARQLAWGRVSPVVTPWRSAAAHVQVALGRVAEAVPLAEEELRHARTWATPRVVGRALRALAATAAGERRLGLLAEAVDLLAGSPAPVELAESLVDLGRARAALGQGRRAREALRDARALADQLAMPRLLRRVDGALGELGERRERRNGTGLAALTDAERRIVGLAAAGRSNNEISELTRLARRTVETHLTNAYRKLGVRRRTQLPRELAEFREAER